MTGKEKTIMNFFKRASWYWRLGDGEKVRLHLSNLRENSRYEPIGWWLRHGRCWLHLWSVTIHCEWYWFHLRGPAIGIELATGEDNVLSGRIGLGFIQFHWSIEHPRLHYWLAEKIKRSDETYGSGRVAEMYWFQDALVINFWSDPMEFRSRDPWYVKGFYIHPLDILFGKRQYSNETLDTFAVEIPMPEKPYPATIKLERALWKRSRWPWPAVIYRADVDIPGGIPFPGKGENSWDCGQDRLFGMMCAAKTVPEAIGKVVESVMTNRCRYGSGIQDVGA